MSNSDKNRERTRVAVYLIAKKNKQILLGKRANVSHMNGYWSLPAGHVYEGESCIKAMQREALEECGLHISEDRLNYAGAMHHNSAPFDYYNLIFTVELEDTDIVINKEPHKCAEFRFFSPLSKPTPMAAYIQYIIDKTVKSKQGTPWVSEYGWNAADS